MTRGHMGCEQESEGLLDRAHLFDLPLVVDSAAGLDPEQQKAAVAKVATAFNELLPIIPLWERYGNMPALDQVRVTGWPPEGDPIYNNSPYADSFVVIMILDGRLRGVEQ